MQNAVQTATNSFIINNNDQTLTPTCEDFFNDQQDHKQLEQ